jgi:Sulfotransferase domain
LAIRVVGAGLGRTGTNSLKLALEELLSGPCYHMFELMQRPQDVSGWARAVRGEPVDWKGFLGEYVATVDWPACAFWRDIHAENPDALVLLSTRDSPEAWWTSMERTIVPVLSQAPSADDPERARARPVILEMVATRFTPDWQKRDAAIAAYENHNEDVRSSVPAGQLIDWRPGDGWQSICAALGMPVPQTPFPHENRTAAFRLATGLDEPNAQSARPSPSAAP